MSKHMLDVPKAPRWINTTAAQWAWSEVSSWRTKANMSFATSERRELLAEAEKLHHQATNKSA